MIPTHNFALLPSDADQDIGETHKNLARIKRKDIEESVQQLRNRTGQEHPSLDPGSSQLRIQAEGLQEQLAEVSPIVFEECYCMDTDPVFVDRVKNTNEISESKIQEMYDDPLVTTMDSGFVGVHLFVMVHGFQGNHNDMRLFKNQISLQHPDAVILLSQSNEDGETEGDLMEMGERLATEVKQYILSFCPISCISKMSFIGHSIGGLIIRAALPHLAEYAPKFFTYISLGSPHLGYMYN